MKKHIVKLISLCLASVLLFGCLSGCSGKKKKIDNLMTEFEYACNTLDVDAMLNCIDPSVSDVARLGLGLYGMFAQKDKDEILDQIAGLLSGDTGLDGNEFFSSVKIEVKKTDVKGEEAETETLLQYKLLGQNFKRDATFYCTKNADKWYISSFYFG